MSSLRTHAGMTIRRALFTALLLSLPAPACAQLGLALEDPSFDPLAASTLELIDPSAPGEPSPGWERAMLMLAGVGVGIGGASVVFKIGMGIEMASGNLTLTPAAVAAALGAVLTIPTGVFLLGNLSGRGADFGWTLLGSVLGALPGAALLAAAFLAGEGADDPTGLFVGGAALASLGVISGSSIAFELSSRPSTTPPPVDVAVGLGSLALTAHFD